MVLTTSLLHKPLLLILKTESLREDTELKKMKQGHDLALSRQGETRQTKPLFLFLFCFDLFRFSRRREGEEAWGVGEKKKEQTNNEVTNTERNGGF